MLNSNLGHLEAISNSVDNNAHDHLLSPSPAPKDNHKIWIFTRKRAQNTTTVKQATKEVPHMEGGSTSRKRKKPINGGTTKTSDRWSKKQFKTPRV